MNMCYVSAWLGMATGIWWQQMSSLHTALDLLQNGGITSGIDMFLNVFWTLHDGAKVFGANVCGQELQWLFTKYTCCMLRICKWIWDVYGATSFSWMCMMFLTIGLTRFSTTNWNRFSATLRLHFFWKLDVVLQQHRGEEECFWNLWEVWDVFGTFVVNSTHVNSPQWKWTTVWVWMDENLFFVFRCHCQDGKAETRATQHSACCMSNRQLCRFVFLCGKELSDWCSASRCFGFFCVSLNTRRGGGRPHCVR